MQKFDYGTLTDIQLLHEIARGDKRAYAQMYQRYWALMYIHARKVLLNEEDARDIVQDVFTYLWDKASEINIKASVSYYLSSAVRYRIFDFLDHKQTRVNYKIYLQNFIEEGNFITDEQVRIKELLALIEKEVARLPKKMREIFELSRNQGLSHQQIAEKLNISESTIKKQIGNAIKILRSKLQAFSFLINYFF